MVSSSKPVAMGSSVPQWPIFLVPSFCRVSATTSCEVISSALSTSRTPSGLALVENVTNFLQNSLFYLIKTSANARAGCKRVASAAEFLTDRADIDGFVFRSHADAHLTVGQFFEENGDDHAAHRAQMIDQTFIIFRKNTQFFCRLQAEAKTRHIAALTETHRAQNFPEQFQTASGVAFVQLLADFANVETSSAHQLRRNLQRAGASL